MTMATAKDIRILPISAKDGNDFCRRIHYSGKVVPNSQLHLGVFVNGAMHGVIQFGPPMVKRAVHKLVAGTGWNGMLELNRLAFDEFLPKNSESRAIAFALRLIKKNYPHIEWILSFADATQCGDGAIYRASGFVLTEIRRNKSIAKLIDGTIATKMSLGKGKYILQNKGKANNPIGAEWLEGFQLRYIYFLNPDARRRLTVPTIPFAKIQEFGAGMYLGKRRASSKVSVAIPDQGIEGGAIPTDALQFSEVANG